ncbi:hypothetical protein BCON_0017g00410 [Botryotinia convoluta]|uniref:Lysine-specific metallo-endopeptidase domain-containing protein n=1 Tax=Botryotinia convoluta TaxID=54673 RepID=A0A4Z1ITY7_9HELO|nr:hypothetical protein BCON_0017g00410 [Botryotinia convoluta]
MRLSSSPLLLPFFLISFSFTSALVAAQALPVDSVWQMKDGATNGGCDANGRKDILNAWQSESWDLASNAYNYISQYSSDKFVRKACSTLFGLKSKNRVSTYPKKEEDLDEITLVFLRLQTYFGTTSGGKKAGLFCGTDWLKLVERGVDAIARDFMGNEIWIKDKPQTIKDVYNEDILINQVPFWSEDLTSYEFSVEEDFCSDDPTAKAATSGLQIFRPAATSGDRELNYGVSLCPFAFDDKDALDTLPPVPAGGNAVVLVGADGKQFGKGTSLTTTLPKSATLFHEAMHVLYGVKFLSDKEKYSLTECINTKWSAPMKRTNPENYVFFALAMWYRQHGFDFSTGKLLAI